jgi:hypothetical protein
LSHRLLCGSLPHDGLPKTVLGSTSEAAL